MRPSFKWGLPVAALLFAAAPGAVEAQNAPALPEGVTQAMIDQGRTIFSGAGNCQACHGANGAGTPFAPKLDDKEWLHIDGSYPAIVKIITDGVSTPKQSMMQMQPKGGTQITDEQVKAVAAYVWSLANGS